MANEKQEPSVEDRVIPLAAIVIRENAGRFLRVRTAPKELVESIRSVGLLHPPVVEPDPSSPPLWDGPGLDASLVRGRFILVIGEKRVLALRELQAVVTRASIRTFSSKTERDASAYHENKVRKDLGLYEECQVVARFVKSHGLSISEASRALRTPPVTVGLYVRAVTKLAPALLEEFSRANEVEARHYLYAARFDTLERQRQALEDKYKRRLSRPSSAVRTGMKKLEEGQHAYEDDLLTERERRLVQSTLSWFVRDRDWPFQKTRHSRFKTTTTTTKAKKKKTS
jgi:ParB/RepB/Spo0J family partition protein